MSYELRKSDGTTLLSLDTGFVDTSSASIAFIGKNVSNFGEYQNNNFLHLLENFASTVEPPNKINGQVWFDKGSHTLKVYDTNKWVSLATVSVGASATAQGTGSLWFNTNSGQLLVNTGTSFTVIGPDDTPGYGATRMVSSVVLDSTSGSQPIIKGVVGAEVIYIISRTEFDLHSSSAIEGFTTIYRGITLKNNSNVKLHGNSTSSDSSKSLLSETGQYITATSINQPNTIVQRDLLGNVQFNSITASAITTSTGLLSGQWKTNNDFAPVTPNVYNLGTNNYPWLNIYAQGLVSSTVSASQVKFSTITDSNNFNITAFDADNTLDANSNSRIPTQKAIKEYIDRAVAQEIQNRMQGDATIQAQINNLETIPSGTVFYTAGLSAPNGFLVANGAWVSKASYPKLFAAIGSIYGSTDTTFRLPDLRGEFVRGADMGRGVDTGRQIGTQQASSTPKHFHGTGQFSARGDDWFEAILRPWGGQSFKARYCSGDERWGVAPILNISGSADEYIATATTDNIDISGDTRPRNVALVPIIKI